MFRNMATSFLKHGRIRTTVQKAKDLRRVVEKLITLAGEDTVARRRQAYGYLQDKAVVHTLFAERGPCYRNRNGGYTRIVRTGRRAGDAAEMCQIQLVDSLEEQAPRLSKGSSSEMVQGSVVEG
jgi:large subunit ribosomal protein L17